MIPAQQEQEPYWFPKPYSDFVARARVPGGFVMLVAFAFVADPSRPSLLFGLPVSVLGLMLRAWATGHLAKDQQLATSGPYAYVRNPLYIGTLLTATGIVIAARSLILAIVFILIFLLVYFPAIELEEHHLREIFPAYSAYAAQVHRLLPVSKWQGARSRFSWSLYVRNREYRALFGLLIASAWLFWRNG